MNVLVDTSVWVAHFRNANATLVDLAGRDGVLGHALVLAEIACGTPPAPREQTLGDLVGLSTLRYWPALVLHRMPRFGRRIKTLAI
jgi:predicted nucleic acid-binding protein